MTLMSIYDGPLCLFFLVKRADEESPVEAAKDIGVMDCNTVIRWGGGALFPL